MIDPIQQFEIDKIKGNTDEQKPKENILSITGGYGINVSGSQNTFTISFDDNVILSLLNKYTLTICVNGVPKFLDAYCFGNPYDPYDPPPPA